MTGSMETMDDYAVALQQAIEYHCGGKIVPREIALNCPYHAKMLNDDLGVEIEQLKPQYPYDGNPHSVTYSMDIEDYHRFRKEQEQ